MEATRESVICELIKKTGKDRLTIENAVKTHRDILESGMRVRSFTYYVAAKIATAANLEYINDDEDEEEEEE